MHTKLTNYTPREDDALWLDKDTIQGMLSGTRKRERDQD